MKRLSGSNQEIAALLYAEQLELSQQNDNVEEAVAAIIQDVRLRGDEALRHYSATFDRVELEHFEVGQDLVDQAFEQVDQAVLTALENAKANIESYHRQQIERDLKISQRMALFVGSSFGPSSGLGSMCQAERQPIHHRS